MKTETTVKTWEKTKLQNLARHKSGRYYARLYLNGKEVWKSPKTAHFSVAEARLAEAQKEHRQQRSRVGDPANAKMTFGQAAALHMQCLDERVALKRRTRKYWREILAALLKSWPSVEGTEIRRVSAAACRKWAARHAKSTSPSRYSHTVGMLRHIFGLAIEGGVLYANPAADLELRQFGQSGSRCLLVRSSVLRHIPWELIHGRAGLKSSLPQ